MKFLYLMLGLVFVLSISLIACNREAANPNPVMSVPTQTATTSATAMAKSEGRWRLVSILSGWTGKTSVPVQDIELVIDNQLQAIYYEGGKEVSRYQYVLTASTSGIRYSVTNQIGKPTLYLQREGNFRVSDQQLIVGDTGVDGDDYTFRRL